MSECLGSRACLTLFGHLITISLITRYHHLHRLGHKAGWDHNKASSWARLGFSSSKDKDLLTFQVSVVSQSFGGGTWQGAFKISLLETKKRGTPLW